MILFIDELHQVVGAGGAEGAIDASTMMKPALARGELHVIGATTLDEYRKHIEKDPALERRFSPSSSTSRRSRRRSRSCKGLRPSYEAHHKVKITDEALEAAARALSDRYITERFLPDKAIDLIDEAASASTSSSSSRCRRSCATSRSGSTSCTRETEAAAATRGLRGGRAHQAGGAAAPGRVRGARRPSGQTTHDRRHDASPSRTSPTLIAQMTGIPVSRMLEGEAEKLLHMEEALHEPRHRPGRGDRRRVATRIRRARAGLKDPKRPIG